MQLIEKKYFKFYLESKDARQKIDRFKARGGGSEGDKTFSDKSDDSWDVLLTAEINVALCSTDEKELFS